MLPAFLCYRGYIMPYLNEDIIDEITVEEIYDLINKSLAEEVENYMEVTEKELQIQSKLFLSAIQKIENEKELFEQKALKMVAFAGNPKSTSYAEEKQNAFEKGILQQEYLLMNNFEKYLSNYRKELQRSAIYVTTNTKGQLTGSYEISMKDLIAYTDKLGYFNQSQIKSLNKQSLEESDLFDKKHVEEAQRLYNGVFNRLERYYELHNVKGDSKISGILLWKNSRGWQAGRVLNYGDLKEAYISFLFDEHQQQLCKMVGGAPPYYNHSAIGKFFDNYINQVTNLSAIVEEDIKVRKQNKQYAIKSAGSHLPSLQQYINIAQSIANLSNYKYINRKWLENKIKEQNPQNAKRNIRMALNTLTTEELNQLKKDFNLSLNLTI